MYNSDTTAALRAHTHLNAYTYILLCFACTCAFGKQIRRRYRRRSKALLSFNYVNFMVFVGVMRVKPAESYLNNVKKQKLSAYINKKKEGVAKSSK